MIFSHSHTYRIPNKNYIELYDNIMNNDRNVLICGAAGSGKSVLLNNCILYAMNNNTPKDLQFIFFDPKIVELNCYKDSYYCFKFCSTIKDINKMMEQLVKIMMQRYKQMEKEGKRKSTEKQIIVVIDELADLCQGYGAESKHFKQLLILLLQKCRASNIKFVVASQNPSRKNLDSAILLNILNRVALRTTSGIESRQILNFNGAESLPKYGYCLMLTPDMLTPTKYEVKYTPEAIQTDIIKSWCKNGLNVIR